MDKYEIDTELQTKAVVIRDGARGWRLTYCLIADAVDLLELPETFAMSEPDESEPEDDSFQIACDYAREMELKLSAAGYTIVHEDGYVIYKDLSEAALEALAERGV